MDNERWSMIKPHQIPYETMTYMGSLCFADTRTSCYNSEKSAYSYLTQSELVNLLGMPVGFGSLNFSLARVSLEFLYLCKKGI